MRSRSTFDLLTVPVAVADLNGDGKLDVAVPNHGNNGVDVLFGNGDGTLQAAQLVGAASQLQSLRAADLNGDGKVDLVGSARGQNKVGVLLGNGNGTFGAAQFFTEPALSPWAWLLPISTATTSLTWPWPTEAAGR